MCKSVKTHSLSACSEPRFKNSDTLIRIEFYPFYHNSRDSIEYYLFRQRIITLSLFTVVPASFPITSSTFILRVHGFIGIYMSRLFTELRLTKQLRFKMKTKEYKCTYSVTSTFMIVIGVN